MIEGAMIEGAMIESAWHRYFFRAWSKLLIDSSPAINFDENCTLADTSF
jgi:hypothetical protein